MCGIAGIYSFVKNRSSRQEFEVALSRLQKRGPDASGIYEHHHVLLGHRRLSIIDTSEGANQPFYDTTQNFVIVFNGEIFNFQKLKDEKLAGKGIQFRTDSDSEVLLYLLIYYGPSCLNWLSGFFAFAFYDEKADKLLIARDRFGKKPLLLYQDEESMVFASELKSILSIIKKPGINPEMLQLYFQFNYIPPAYSILENTRKLKPGNFIIIEKDVVTESNYYCSEIQSDQYHNLSYDDARAKLVELMQHSVEERMISDVPLGAFLSGGIDSSVVVAMASRFTSKLKTFSIGYKDNPLFDESGFADLVAKKYQTDHQVFFLGERDYKEEVFNILDYLDEPFADSSCIPQYILCKKTKQHVTVALSGDGGDEVFAGYNKHKAEWIIRNKHLFRNFVRIGAPFLKLLPQNKNTRIGNINRQIVKLADGANLNKAERYIRWCGILNPQSAAALFTQQYRSKMNQIWIENVCKEYSDPIRTNDFNEVLLSDIRFVLPGDMLHKVDMMSMANSLEVRSPFLDYKIVDFAFQLPSSYKIDQDLKKKIVQDAFRQMLPPELYNRPKQGFEIPLLEWFRNEFNSFIFDDLLNRSFIEEQQIFDYAQIEKIRQRLHSKAPGNIQATIWALIVFQHWYRKYML